jgi:hypothetical protein
MSAVTAARSAGPRRERLRYPQVELFLGQPVIHVRGLEQFNNLLPVAPGDTKAAIPSASLLGFVR